MFERLKTIASKAKRLNSVTIWLQLMQENSKEVHEIILDINRVDQLMKESIDVNGVQLKKYSRFTEIENEGKRFTYKGVTREKTRLDGAFLYDEGDFFDTFKVIDLYGSFKIYADTVKEGKDLRSYGEILGINEEFYKKILVNILPLLAPAIRKYLLQQRS